MLKIISFSLEAIPQEKGAAYLMPLINPLLCFLASLSTLHVGNYDHMIDI